MKNIKTQTNATQGQAAEIQSEVICVKVNSDVDKMLLESVQLIINSELTDGQKMLRVYDIFESSLQEYIRAQKTFHIFCDEHNIDEQALSGDLNVKQADEGRRIFNYIRNMRKFITALGDSLYNTLISDDMPYNHRDALEQHYHKFNYWPSDIRSGVIRRLQRDMRGFKIREKKEEQ